MARRGQTYRREWSGTRAGACVPPRLLGKLGDLVSLRRDRKIRGDRYFSDPDRKLFVVLGEEAVRRVIGTPRVHAGQLNRLLEMSELPNVSIQVVPLDAGSHAALEYMFTMLYIARARASIQVRDDLEGAADGD